MMGYTTAGGAQGICPTGWHVPTHTEMTDLERSICTSGTCATDFPYDTTTTGWRGTDEASKLSDYTLDGNNSSGFSALLAGYRVTDGSFTNQSTSTILWSSTESDSNAWLRSLYSGYSAVVRNASSKANGGSVRCVQD